MSDIVFKIGPRINASGRMENGKESVDLLVERDYGHALHMAKHINEYNEQRKDIDKQMTEEANLIVSRLENLPQPSDPWTEGGVDAEDYHPCRYDTLIAVATIVGHYDDLVAALTDFVLEDDEVARADIWRYSRRS